MIIRKPAQFRYSQITPRQVYMNRRRFLAAGTVGLSALARPFGARAAARLPGTITKSPFSTEEAPTSQQALTTYNNFYEFGTGKDEPAKNAKNFHTTPWTVSIEGAVAKPKTLDLDAIMKLAPLEECIYRHRCVEGWSFVIPWVGFPLSALLKQVEPTPKAKYVAFQSYYDPKQMLSSREAHIQFPYIEGLRLDEAMHPLALLAVGIYGDALPPQNGAPLRLALPWKYGFKSIKSIAKIRFVESQPPTTWNLEWPEAYGFYANVNPEVDHPTHSQATEVRLGVSVFGMRMKTRMFNGYDQVASLYSGMNLHRSY
ncbi:MAG TPA: protein-methionine-sulfoxide reductase catalytic subunit MsrP [Bryobacteraceae bacterium]|jgi:sulfoxide reductase catalytic subunit YedY|nr:protein-methionine-sulfoxide reductase catalytic subunit MsrP [Bryobacteraceae bacterium]